MAFIHRPRGQFRAWHFAAVALCVAGSVLARPAGGQTIAGDILIQLDRTAALQPLLAKYPVTLVDRFGTRPIYRLRTIGAASVDATIRSLALEPGVLNAEPNFAHASPEARRNVVWAVGSAQAYAAQWAPQALRLPEAQRVAQGQGVRVAVLDTGVDATHPALAGRLLRGFDFVDFDTLPAEGGTRADVAFGHGTHVAGLVALAAPQARIMPLRVLDTAGTTNAWVLGQALIYAVDPDGNPTTDDGAHVINMSLSSPVRTRLLDTVGSLASCGAFAPGADLTPYTDAGYNGDKARCAAGHGAVVVAAAGNDASASLRQYPAAEGLYGLLAVTASNAAHDIATFANSGGWIDLAAPGDRITSAVPGGWGTWSGTSMAAPLAAGTAALLLSAQPTLAPVDVVKRLKRSASALCDTKLRQIDAAAALGLPPAITVCE